MFKLLKSYRPESLLLIIFLAASLFIKYFFDSNIGLDQNTEAYSLYKWIVLFFYNLESPVLNKLLALILILFEALLFTIISNHYNIFGKRSYLPMLIYLLIIINLIHKLEINAILFANILFLNAWLILKKARNKDNALSNYFNASLLIGLSSLIYFNFIYLFFILWINLIIIRGPKLRELIFSVLGIIIIWYFVFAYYYLNDISVAGFSQKIIYSINFNDFKSLELSEKISRVFIIILFSFSIFSLLKYFNNLKIDIRNNLKLLFSIFIMSILIIVFTNSSLEMIHLTAVPISLFIANYLISMKNNFWSHVFLTTFFLITIFNLYLGFLIN